MSPTPLTIAKRSASPPFAIAKRSASPPFQQANDPTQSHTNDIIDLTISDDDDNEDLGGVPSTSTTSIEGSIRNPGIPEMLAELHREYKDLNFPQYEGVLMGNGFVYVGQLVEKRVRWQLQELGFGIGVINLLLSRAERVMRRAEKVKQE